MPDKKTMAEWEKEAGVIIDGADPKAVLSSEDFAKIAHKDMHGVDHNDRIKFLKENGYDVTRENMVDPKLSAREEK